MASRPRRGGKRWTGASGKETACEPVQAGSSSRLHRGSRATPPLPHVLPQRPRAVLAGWRAAVIKRLQATAARLSLPRLLLLSAPRGHRRGAQSLFPSSSKTASHSLARCGRPAEMEKVHSVAAPMRANETFDRPI